MIDDMTSSNDRINRGPYFACPACHSRTPSYSDIGEEINRTTRQSTLRSHVEYCRGNRQAGSTRLSAGFVIEQAATRYFEMMEATFEKLRGKFTDDDFVILLNMNCSPIWEHIRGWSLASYLEDEQREVGGQEFPELIRKLHSLSFAEELAVVEACERVWRGYVNPLL